MNEMEEAMRWLEAFCDKKPVVRYYDYMFAPEIGTGMHVKPLNHPKVKKGKWAYTTPVVAIWRDGSWETWNTRYVPLMPAQNTH